MKKILVIGGAGYIGSHMVRALLDANCEPVIFDNLSTGHRDTVPRGVPFIKGDLRNEKDIEKAFVRFDVEAVMHFAASSLVGESVVDPLKYYDNNVCSCINLLKVMAKHKVKRMVFSSTAAVYGEPEKVPITEDALLVPTNPYGHSKLMIERIIEDVACIKGVEYIFLRYFNVAGAHSSGEISERHDPETHLVPNVLKSIKGKAKVLTVFGNDYKTPDGTCVRDYVHVEDLCRAHLLALKALKQGIKNQVFNLGNGSGFSIMQIIKATELVTGKEVKYKVGSRRAGDPARLVASSVKAKKILGWQPTMGIEEIISSAWKSVS